MVSPRFFRDRAFSAANAVVLLAGFALLGFVFFNTLVFQAVQGWSPLQAGLRSLPNTLAVVVSAPLAGRLASRYGYRVPVTAGLLLAAAALWALTGIEVGTPYAQLWWKLAMLGAGLGLSISPAAAAGVAAMPGTQAGVASAVISTSRPVGGPWGGRARGGGGRPLRRRHPGLGPGRVPGRGPCRLPGGRGRPGRGRAGGLAVPAPPAGRPRAGAPAGGRRDRLSRSRPGGGGGSARPGRRWPGRGRRRGRGRGRRRRPGTGAGPDGAGPGGCSSASGGGGRPRGRGRGRPAAGTGPRWPRTGGGRTRWR